MVGELSLYLWMSLYWETLPRGKFVRNRRIISDDIWSVSPIWGTPQKLSLKFEKQTKSAIKECYSAVQPRKFYPQSTIKDHRAHYSTKYGRITIRVPLWLPWRGPNFVTNARENYSTYPEVYPQQSKSYQNFPKTEYIAKKRLIHPSLRNVTQQLDYIFFKTRVRQHLKWQQFSILARTRNAFHLSALEATYIKTLKPF